MADTVPYIDRLVEAWTAVKLVDGEVPLVDFLSACDVIVDLFGMS
jgi:hypothetical protein